MGEGTGGSQKKGFFKRLKLELSIEGQNRISHVKTEGRHFRQREQNVRRSVDKKQLGTLSMVKQIARKGRGEGKLAQKLEHKSRGKQHNTE